MPGKTGFDFNGASQSFNVLAEYLFGKNTTKEKMEMTTPVFMHKTQSDEEKMEMTTPTITNTCKGTYYIAKLCPEKAEWDKHKIYICLFCQQRGHSLKNCRKKNENDMEGSYVIIVGKPGIRFLDTPYLFKMEELNLPSDSSITRLVT